MDMQIMRILGDLMSWIYKYNFDHAILDDSLFTETWLALPYETGKGGTLHQTPWPTKSYQVLGLEEVFLILFGIRYLNI